MISLSRLDSRSFHVRRVVHGVVVIILQHCQHVASFAPLGNTTPVQ